MWLIFALIGTLLVSASTILEKKVLLKEHALGSAYMFWN
jgi:hypothetical protein